MSTPYGQFPIGYGEPSLPEGASMASANHPTILGDTAQTVGLPEYVVLQAVDEGDQTDWRYVRNVKAEGAASAIKKAIGPPAEATTGTYVAVPARSWKPTRVTTKVETTLALEDA